MRVHVTTAYLKNEEVDVKFGRYASNADVAIELYSPNGEKMSTATVNLEDVGYNPRPLHVFIKDSSENAGMYAALLKAGIVRECVQIIRYGAYEGCTAYECPLSDASIEADREQVRNLIKTKTGVDATVEQVDRVAFYGEKI